MMCKTYKHNRCGSQSDRRVDLYNTGAGAYRQNVVRDSMCTILIYILISGYPQLLIYSYLFVRV